MCYEKIQRSANHLAIKQSQSITCCHVVIVVAIALNSKLHAALHFAHQVRAAALT